SRRSREGVRADGPVDSQLGGADGARCGPSPRWADQRGTAGAYPAAAREPGAARRARDTIKSRGLVRDGDRFGAVTAFEFDVLRDGRLADLDAELEKLAVDPSLEEKA